MKKINGVLTNVEKNDIAMLEINPTEFWKDVNEIGANAFTDSGIVNIVIPNTIKKIGDRAFWSCKKLETVTIPQSVKKINHSAFHWCWNLTKVLMPETIEEIEDFAFAGCEKLDTLIIPEGVEKIGNGAFAHCHNFTKIVLPESVKDLGVKVFDHCKKLKEVYIMGKFDLKKETFAGMKEGAKLFIRDYEAQAEME